MTSLSIRRRIPSSVDRVWRAFTTPDELAAWLWPPSWTTAVEIDLRVGGRYSIAAPEYGLAVSGEYVAIDAPHRLVQTWVWSDDLDETLVTIVLEESDGQVDVTLTHERFGDDERRDSNLQGWNDCLDRLPPHLAADGDS